ncbi:MAG: RHS repeat protein [Lachnospiraceae bacterium]|nr:RHS repeat protein [Lachnospiraceae bacterium]
MGKRIIFILKVLIINYCFSLLISELVEGGLPINNMSCVYAQGQDIQYDYDSLGRVSSARYPNGTEVKFEYDANGNLLHGEVVKGQKEPDSSEETGGSQGNTEETGGSAGDNSGNGGSDQDGDNQQTGGTTGDSGGGQGTVQEPPEVSGPTGYTSDDVREYNRFKKRKPVIKSLKKTQSKKKYYLNIKIKQINKRGAYGETEYQIKYATNSKFKKTKTIKVKRSKKGSLTGKKWKIKKGKTYYVKVRAVMKTKTGKTIYSKYSKTKELKVE